jgi:hypothetical protein
MLNIYPSDTIWRQLKKQGYRFKVGTDVDWFEDMLLGLENLYINDYVTETEYKKIRERFLDDLEKNYITKIDPEQPQATVKPSGTLRDLSKHWKPADDPEETSKRRRYF